MRRAVNVEVAWSVYQNMIDAYREHETRTAKAQM